MSWENMIIDAIDQRKQQGGADNVFQPAKLISVNPPVVEVCGVQVKKQLQLNPAMKQKQDLAPLELAFDNFMEKFKELEEHKEELPEPKDLVDKMLELLVEPMQAMFEASISFHQKGLVQSGDTVMVRQNGNDIHIMNGTGG